MKLMNSYSKLSISILFATALLTGVMSVALKQSAIAFPIDLGGLTGLGGTGGLEFLKGPKGDKGDTGPPGPQGERGPPGPEKEFKSTTKVSKTIVVPGDISRDVNEVVNCNDNTRVTGGGFETSNPDAFHLSASKPLGNGWQVKGIIEVRGDERTLIIYAQCGELINTS
jgi:hypothetical protein